MSKPSDSKSARAARKRKSRKLGQERADRDRRRTEEFNKLSTVEQIQVRNAVKKNAEFVAAGKGARIERMIEAAAAKAAKEEGLTVSHADSDGKLVYERIEIPQKPRPEPIPQPAKAVPVPANMKAGHGEGDPTVKKVLIQHRSGGRRVWCDPDKIPEGWAQPLANCGQHERPGSIPPHAVARSDDWFIRACQSRNPY